MCALPAGSSNARKRLRHALKATPCGFHLVLADYSELKGSGELRALLLESEGALFIVPAGQQQGEGEVLVFGGRLAAAGMARKDGGVFSQCERAVIEQAQDDKAQGRPFCRVAKERTRLEELLSSGTAASKLLHLFSRTPGSLRSKLQLDGEARFSVTDEAMADKMTEEVGTLSGVGRSTSIIDATACVGGNTLSFAKIFEDVIAIENDEARCGMLRENVALLGRTARVKPIHGDCVTEVPNY